MSFITAIHEIVTRLRSRRVSNGYGGNTEPDTSATSESSTPWKAGQAAALRAEQIEDYQRQEGDDDE